MAVVIEKSEKFVPFLWALVKRNLVLAEMVTQVSGESFVGALDDTVTMRVDGMHATSRDYEWRTRNNPIVLDDIAGGAKVAIKLDRHAYSATGLTDEHMRMDVTNFTEEVLTPQAEAVAERIEANILAGFNTMDTEVTMNLNLDNVRAGTLDMYKFGVEGGRRMSPLVPKRGRFWLVGQDVHAAIVASDRFAKFDQAGPNATTAMESARVGRIAGWNVVYPETVDLDPKTSIFMHRSALVFGNLAPEVPQGVNAGRRFTSGDFSLRWIADYDSNYLRDRSVVSSFYGLSFLYDRRKGFSWDAPNSEWDISQTSDRYDLKPWITSETPVTFRAIKCNVTGSGEVVDV